LNGGNIDFLTSLITLVFFPQESLIIVLNNCIDLFILRLLWLLIEERDWGSLGGKPIRCKLLVVFSVEFRILLVFCIIDIIG
jgi:hypothetical protein